MRFFYPKIIAPLKIENKLLSKYRTRDKGKKISENNN